ncbi:MAG: hypothetical protein JNM43_21650 [Planctomycetaceae bacterium]|nr:hypothetical protein [Planctomycetaceae bacterium]
MSWFSARKSSRRKYSRVSAAAEVFEERAMLTQLVPVEDYSGWYPQVVNTTAAETLLASYRPESKYIDLQILNHATKKLSAPQTIRGTYYVEASPDGRTIATQFASGEGSSKETTILFYKRNADGKFIESARYVFPASPGESLPYIESNVTFEGGYARLSPSKGIDRLLWLSASETIKPKVVFEGEDWLAPVVVRRGDETYLTVFGQGPRLMTSGVPGKAIGRPSSEPQVRIGNRLLSLTGWSYEGWALISTDTSTGEEVSLMSIAPRYGFGADVPILVTDQGPSGKSIFLLPTESRWKVVVTDGTAAGTSTYLGTAVADLFTGHTTAVYVPATQSVIANWGGNELWSFDLRTASWHQVIDTNMYGGDQITSLTVKEDGAWFEALESDGDYGLYRTNGIETTNEYDFVARGGLEVVGDHDSTWLVNRGYFTVLPSTSVRLYELKLDAEAPVPGPSGLSAEIRNGRGGRTLHIEWSAQPDARNYEVHVTPFVDSGEDRSFLESLNESSWSQSETTFDVPIDDKSLYGWQSIHVRSVGAYSAPSEWTSIQLAMTDALSPPKLGQFFFVDDELRFGVRSLPADWNDLSLTIRRSQDSSILYKTEYLGDYMDLISHQSPFQSEIWNELYRYVRIPTFGDGDYLVTLTRQYIDPNPTPVDMSLPASEVTYPLSLRRGQVVLNPDAVNVAAGSESVRFSWAGTQRGTETGFQLLVNDLSRGVPRVINTSVVGHSFEQSLPNGRYRAFVGRKDSITGQTFWSPAKEFVVTRQTPTLTNPVVESTRARPSFLWSGDKAFDYEVWVNDLGTGKRVAFDRVTRTTTWIPSFDLPAGRYAIWVRQVVASNAVSNWSPRHVFVQHEPAIIVTDGLNPGLDQTPTITWAGRTDATSYDIWVNQAGKPGAVYLRSGLSVTSHTIEQPIGNGVFTVWVRAVLRDGRPTPWGTGQKLIIGAPVVVSITGSALAWTTSPTATQYEVWINYEGGEGPKAAKVVNDASYKSTVFALPTTLLRGRYRAWVRAIRQDGLTVYAGDWSKTIEFTI